VDKDNPFRWLGFGIEFAVLMGGLGYGGYWADQKLGHRFPWLLLLGVAVAFAVMMLQVFQEIKKLQK